jgi:predicted dehydrogenase
VQFSNGIIFTGTWCFTVAPELKEDLCEIIGNKGKISFSMFGNQVSIRQADETEELVFTHPEHIQQPMIEQVVRYFAGEGPNPCSATDAIASMALMEQFVSGA